MQRNTITTLGKLHEGDRFTYPKRVDPWQVMNTKGTKVAVNQINAATGQRIHKYDEFKSQSIQVRFLRHTKPLPHEECLIGDLEIGDVFFFNDASIVFEWTVKNKSTLSVTVCREKHEMEIMWTQVVTFVRKQTVTA